ncbi:MAG: hypothetical protein SNG35_00940 [Rikenellaceae bacterium]
MNINAKIDWREGLELTPELFVALESGIERRRESMVTIMGDEVAGVIPYSRFECEPTFVRKSVEIAHLRCLAMLPSGRLLDVDEAVVLQMPMLYGEEYYLTVSEESETTTSYSERGVDLLKPNYIYAINTLADIEESRQQIPLVKFNVRDGVFSIATEYIPPFIQLNSHDEFGRFVATCSDLLSGIAEHANFESGEGQRTFIRYAFMFKHYNLNSRVKDLVALTIEITMALNYYIVEPNNQTPLKVEGCSIYDIVRWMKLFIEYINGASSILDGVVLEDKSIDMDRLKAEIKAELHEQIYEELFQRLYSDMSVKLREEITEEIRGAVVGYINDELRDVLHRNLKVELSDEMTAKLFDELYVKLYDALYVKPEEEEEFIPIM